MKNLISFFVICLIWISLATPFSFAQDRAENLLEKVELKFSLSGDPTPENVGFGYRKSYWRLEYELVLTDSSTLIKELNQLVTRAKSALLCISESKADPRDVEVLEQLFAEMESVLRKLR